MIVFKLKHEFKTLFLNLLIDDKKFITHCNLSYHCIIKIIKILNDRLGKIKEYNIRTINTDIYTLILPRLELDITSEYSYTILFKITQGDEVYIFILKEYSVDKLNDYFDTYFAIEKVGKYTKCAK